MPKKCTSAAKKYIRKIFKQNKGYSTALNAFSLGKSLSTGNSIFFYDKQTDNKT